MRRLRARLAPGQRVLLVICLAVTLAAGAASLPDGSGLQSLPLLWFSSPAGGAIIIGPGSPSSWLGLAVFLVAIAVWAGLSVPLLADPGSRPGKRPGRRWAAPSGMAQRVVLVIGLGAALAVTGLWANTLATGSPSSSGFFAIAPLTRSVYLSADPGLPGWAHALIWLGVIAIWAAASWRLLGRRPGSAPAAAPAPSVAPAPGAETAPGPG